MPEYKKYEEMIGGTPMINLNNLLSAEALARGVTLLGKAEFLNPGFSQKDRVAKAIFDEAEACGALKPGGTVIAASSGNTGAAAAMMGAMRGYKVIIVTNSKCSQEKMDRYAPISPAARDTTVAAKFGAAGSLTARATVSGHTAQS
jgi:cysteine synthase A